MELKVAVTVVLSCSLPVLQSAALLPPTSLPLPLPLLSHHAPSTFAPLSFAVSFFNHNPSPEMDHVSATSRGVNAKFADFPVARSTVTNAHRSPKPCGAEPLCTTSAA